MNIQISYVGSCKTFLRHCSSAGGIKAINLKGRDILSPVDISKNELKSILWTANEMKAKRACNILSSKHMTYLYSIPLARNQVTFERAVQLLGGHYSVFNRQDWGDVPDLSDCGSVISAISDLVVTNGLHHEFIEEMANSSSVPIISARCNIFANIKALADIFTLLEVLGPLRRKTLAWIGPSTPISESYLCLMPKLGMKMRVFFFCPGGSGQMSPMHLSRAHESCTDAVEIHECSSMEEAIYRADIIATSPHRVLDKKITFKALEEAQLEWFFLHCLPRTQREVSDDVFKHKNNLTWRSAHNTIYIYMALLTRLLTNYELTTSMPDFDGPP